MDILYTIKQNDYNPELQYSLRTLKCIPHDRVFIVGGCPPFINRSKVTYIETPTLTSKYLTTTNNLRVACEDERLSDNFIYMNDDFFIMHPIKDIVSELNLSFGKLSDVLFYYKSKYQGKTSSYITGMEETMKYLQDTLHISNPISYELHIPFIFNKKRYLKMLELPWIDKLKVLHKRTVYGNLYMKGSKAIKDVKILSTSDFHSYDMPKMKFISSSDASWKSKLKYYFMEILKEKSPYEL